MDIIAGLQQQGIKLQTYEFDSQLERDITSNTLFRVAKMQGG